MALHPKNRRIKEVEVVICPRCCDDNVHRLRTKKTMAYWRCESGDCRFSWKEVAEPLRRIISTQIFTTAISLNLWVHFFAA